MKVEMKNGSVLLYNGEEKPIKIPSQLYPLPGTLAFITHKNTEPFPDESRTEKIRKVFDGIEAQVGACYTNTEHLIEALEKEGIAAEAYVGWVLHGDSKPFHHCFAAIDRRYILDFSFPADLFHSDEYKDMDLQLAREKLTDKIIELESLPNSQKFTFGQISQYCVYIASRCKPQAGAALFHKLLRSHPNQPSYTDLNESGMSKTQEMLFQKRGRAGR